MGISQDEPTPGGWAPCPITIDELYQHYSSSVWNPDSIAGKFTVDGDNFLIDRLELKIVDIFPEDTLEISGLSGLEDVADRISSHPWVRESKAKSPYVYAVSLKPHDILNYSKGELKCILQELWVLFCLSNIVR